MKCDYCTASPDEVDGIRFTAACFIHDYDYAAHGRHSWWNIPGVLLAKKNADDRLMHNIALILKTSSATADDLRIPSVYMAGVVLGGWRAYWACVRSNAAPTERFRLTPGALWGLNDYGMSSYWDMREADGAGLTLEGCEVAMIVQRLIDARTVDALNLAHGIIDSKIEAA